MIRALAQNGKGCSTREHLRARAHRRGQSFVACALAQKACRDGHLAPYLRTGPAALFLRFAPERFFLTKTNTYCTIEMPASLRSETVRLRPGMPFAFPSESAFAFAGILTCYIRSRVSFFKSTRRWAQEMDSTERVGTSTERL